MKQLLCLFIAFVSLFSFSQESEAIESAEFKKHRISLGLGHTHIPSSELIEGRNKLAFASWTLDYDFHFNERWAIGLQTDLIMESFIIKRFNQEEIERAIQASQEMAKALEQLTTGSMNSSSEAATSASQGKQSGGRTGARLSLIHI